MNIRKHKKKLSAVLVLGVAAAISIPLLIPQLMVFLWNKASRMCWQPFETKRSALSFRGIT